MRHRGFYSIVGEPNDAWSQLSILKVFQPDDWRSTLDLVDVFNPCEQPRKIRQLTFHDAEDLDTYLASNPVTGGTRFMSFTSLV